MPRGSRVGASSDLVGRGLSNAGTTAGVAGVVSVHRRALLPLNEHAWVREAGEP